MVPVQDISKLSYCVLEMNRLDFGIVEVGILELLSESFHFEAVREGSRHLGE